MSASRVTAVRASAGIVAGGALTLVCGIRVSLLLADDPALVNWSFTHWAFSYDFGLVKRGLAGEVLSWFVEPGSLFAAVRKISLFNSVAVCAGLAYFFLRPFVRDGGSGRLAFAIVATTHFATLQHVVYDVGRFDHLGFLLLFVCLASIEKSRVSVIPLALSCVVGLLIHEAFAILFLPLIIAYWVYSRADLKGGWVTPAAVTMLLAGLVLSLVLLGRPSTTDAEYVRHLKERHGAWIDEGSVAVLFAGIQDGMRRSWDVFTTGKRLLQHLVLGVFLLPSLTLAARIALRPELAQTWRSARDRKAVLLFPAALSPLALYAVGVDFARWWALAITLAFLALGLLMWRSEAWSCAVERAFEERRALAWSLLAFSAVAGPLGVAAASFPRLEPVVRAAVIALLDAIKG